MIFDIVVGFIFGVAAVWLWQGLKEWIRPRDCWNPRARDMPSFEERIKKIKEAKEKGQI